VSNKYKKIPINSINDEIKKDLPLLNIDGRRDKAMAEGICRYSNQRIPTLVIAGNYHTMINREGSMASFLSEERQFTGLELKYQSGSYFNHKEYNFFVLYTISSTHPCASIFSIPKINRVQILFYNSKFYPRFPFR
jgi:hypothetical protein